MNYNKFKHELTINEIVGPIHTIYT